MGRQAYARLGHPRRHRVGKTDRSGHFREFPVGAGCPNQFFPLGPGLVAECADIAARRDDGALLSVSMLTARQFDREVLTQRFMREISRRRAREERRPTRSTRRRSRARCGPR